jgi:hypothetical protein
MKAANPLEDSRHCLTGKNGSSHPRIIIVLALSAVALTTASVCLLLNLELLFSTAVRPLGPAWAD